MKTPGIFADRIELCGGRDLYFDQCRRVLECCDVMVLAETAGQRVTVWGEGLRAGDYSGGGLHIHGRITAIELDGGRP